VAEIEVRHRHRSHERRTSVLSASSSCVFPSSERWRPTQHALKISLRAGRRGLSFACWDADQETFSVPQIAQRTL